MFEKEIATPFKDLSDAGKQLADHLASYKQFHPLVLAIPFQGLAVGYQVAKRLGCVLSTYATRSIPAPNDPHTIIGALSQDGFLVLDDHLIGYKKLSGKSIRQAIALARRQLEEEVRLLKTSFEVKVSEEQIIILVTEGVHTTLTARCAGTSLQLKKPEKLVLATPVCPHNLVEMLEAGPEIDEIVNLRQPIDMVDPKEWYEDFSQLTAVQAKDLLLRNQEDLSSND